MRAESRELMAGYGWGYGGRSQLGWGADVMDEQGMV
jgi:hypothetical protein